MASGKITKRSVDATKSGSRDAFLWDDELRGFGLKVTPAGRKVYLVQYRSAGAKPVTKRFTVGTHGELTPDQARQEAKGVLADIARGSDPAKERAKARRSLTLGQALDKFLDEHADAKLKASTASEYRRIAKNHIPSTLRSRPIGEVERGEIARHHLSLKRVPYRANRVLALLSKLFSWTEAHGLRPDGANPCKHVKKYKEQGRERFLSEVELARLSDALRDNEEPSPYPVAAIRLLILTGARLNEILTLEWAHVDLEKAALRLPDSKTGRKTIFLNAPALAILNALPRINDNPYVIPGAKSGARLVNLQKPWRRIRAKAKLDDVRIHDLRHSHASIGAGGGLSLPVIGALLGHTQAATTQRYAHLANDPLRAASEAIGSRIAAAMDVRPGGAAETNVVSLGKRGA